MSYRIRLSVVSSLFGSNHFVIAACAAIAMVLGAMSVGASVSDAPAPQQANISSTTITTGSGATRLPRTDEKLTPQHTLEPKLIIQPNKATAEKLKGAAKVQYQLNELLTPVASSLFVDQTSLLNELQARVSTNPLNTGTTNGITPPTDTGTAAATGNSTVAPGASAPVTSPNPAPPTSEQPTPPEAPSEGSGAQNPPLPPSNP